MCEPCTIPQGGAGLHVKHGHIIEGAREYYNEAKEQYMHMHDNGGYEFQNIMSHDLMNKCTFRKTTESWETSPALAVIQVAHPQKESQYCLVSDQTPPS